MKMNNIYRLNNEIFENGISRYRYVNGDTIIGSQYFSRTGRRRDERIYQLYRFEKSGEIEYHELIKRKDDSVWRDLARYGFNPETLKWTQLENKY